MKKIIVTLCTVVSFAFASTVHADTCENEKQLIQSMKTHLEAINSELLLAKTNRNATVVSGIGSLIAIFSNLKYAYAFSLDQNGQLAHIAAAGTFAALASYNVYLTHKDVKFYQEMSVSVQQSIEEREFELKSGLCLTDKVVNSRNAHIKELYKALVKTNLTLQKDIQNLNKELGNLGTKASTVANVGASILLVAGATIHILSRNPAEMVGVSAGAAAFGVIIAMGSQVENLPSLIMSAREARVLLSEAKASLEEFKKQESVLREILNHEG